MIAAGGFEADPRGAPRTSGRDWDVAKVRGTPYNTGRCSRRCSPPAPSHGHWSGCHSIAWDADAPATGDRGLTNRLSRQSYPLGLVVNRDGERFLDEGADFRNYTYARYGAEILRQPGAIAYQLFDAQTTPLLRIVEYESPGASRQQADTIAELPARLGIDADRLGRTVAAFNDAVTDDRSTRRSRMASTARHRAAQVQLGARRSTEPPFLAFPVTCGITFTFGGVRVDERARVIDRSGRPMPGLHAAGEVVGGLFFHNYPGGSGLMSGAVFGRRAGRSAAVLTTRGESRMTTHTASAAARPASPPGSTASRRSGCTSVSASPWGSPTSSTSTTSSWAGCWQLCWPPRGD